VTAEPNLFADEVNLGNWRQAPWSRWAFQHVADILPVAPIAGDPERTQPLPRSHRDLSGVAFSDASGRGWTVGQMLAQTDTDGFLVLHAGKLAFEWYGNGLTPTRPHIAFSVSKSITAILAGILVARGELDPEAPVVRYIPEAAGTAYGDCSVRHVLDMTVAITFEESYLDETGAFARYRVATGWNPPSQAAPATDLKSFLLTLPRASGPHGERFHYVSPNSDMLGWIIERAAGRAFAPLLSELIWQPMGAEIDAYVTIDSEGAARTAGGICVSLPDLARFGEMMRNRGRVGNRPIVPLSWITDILDNGDPAAWAKGTMAHLLPGGRYRSKWYVTGNDHGAWCAIGIHGQWLYIDPKAELVIAKFSSQSLPLDDATDRLMLKAFAAIGDYLGT
jgi:CubicO group peptidase (beta-lactamase class C family)